MSSVILSTWRPFSQHLRSSDPDAVCCPGPIDGIRCGCLTDANYRDGSFARTQPMNRDRLTTNFSCFLPLFRLSPRKFTSFPAVVYYTLRVFVLCEKQRIFCISSAKKKQLQVYHPRCILFDTVFVVGFNDKNKIKTSKMDRPSTANRQSW